MGLSVFDGEE